MQKKAQTAGIDKAWKFRIIFIELNLSCSFYPFTFWMRQFRKNFSLHCKINKFLTSLFKKQVVKSFPINLNCFVSYDSQPLLSQLQKGI